MKKALLKSLALAVVGSFCVVGAANAAPMLVGGLSMSGAFFPTNTTNEDATITNATGIDFVDDEFIVVTASGSFDGLRNAIGSIEDFQFDSYTNSGESFWSVRDFSFEMTSLTYGKDTTFNGNSRISVSGLGMMRADGFDATPGEWNFTGQGVNNANFSWSASAGTAPVPEPATMLLFGTGLIGLASISARRRKKQLQAM